MTESPVFDISQATITAVEKRVDGSGTLDYVRQVLGIMFEEQPELYSEIKKTARRQPDISTYSAGAAVAFDAITSQLKSDQKEVIITVEDLEVHQQNLFEYFEDPRWQNLEWAEEQLSKGDRPTTNLSWFADKLSNNSPTFAVLLREILTCFVDDLDKMKSTFVRGFFDVAMPFLNKMID